ncbi:DUF4249 domain-containing protein [Maribacter sp. HTCC2170]|uniref:DUF4249 domain-containing protein n=1 Tax=Maribacter sp. (strain HTCC2170 / KCCM 42371) TaxID=313603 RepID=UPI00130518DF|nr:DUF4249 domain-containing protein [Maribacter sp. HTCC2170]
MGKQKRTVTADKVCGVVRFVCVFIIVGWFNACVESIDFVIPNRKNLVVDALLTNEIKHQEVKLSYAYKLENDSIAKASGATVTIVDNLQNEYLFNETEEGHYISNNEFAAQAGVGYQLMISTNEGKKYSSKVEAFNGVASVSNLWADKSENFNGDAGILISVDGSSDTSALFRYEYEETYKIVAPKYIGLDFELTNYDPCSWPLTYDLDIVVRDDQQQICYGNRKSNQIILGSTAQQSQNNFEKHPIKFISADDFAISHRYSILVKQYVQSVDAYNYFSTLKDISTSENLFSDSQPGFLEGNMMAEDSENNLVLGYFEVASVSSKRLFFNYEDYFPDAELPDYPIDCENNFIQPEIEHDVLCNDNADFPHRSCGRSLLQLIDENLVAYVTEVVGPFEECEGPYVAVPRVCGDCTELGSNIVPDFWIE